MLSAIRQKAEGQAAVRSIWLCLVLLCCLVPPAAQAAQPIHYVVDLNARAAHLVQVTMTIPEASAGTEIQIPTWNCLYQIRDFVQSVQDLNADCDGHAAHLSREDLNTWCGPSGSCSNLAFHYAVYADADGPFDSMLDGHHSFLNLAMILFYLPRERSRPVEVNFKVPAGWKLATLLEGEGEEFRADNYDILVDSPIEAGNFEDYSYQQDFTSATGSAADSKRATIRLVIDADSADYSAQRILASAQKITATETALMQDLPFRRYTFILHFSHDGGTGGMEHRNGAAITVPASRLSNNDAYLESVMAHEFFHLWNVKRIRPQALEPVDYINGNDTRDLWLCEGVTNTYAQLVLLRAGLISRDTFLAHVASAIEVLQERGARTFQSVETSGREAWLEKYPAYNRPERSISYYNKGELLGYLLDLGIRHASQNRAGLDDVMRRLNRDFAQRGRFYTHRDFASIVSQLVPTFDTAGFLKDDVQGTKELDYTTYLGYAGLDFSTQSEDLAQSGFSTSRDAHGSLQVDSVDVGSDAESAGLLPGDLLVSANGDPLPASPDSALPLWRPGQAVDLRITRGGEPRNLKFKVGATHQLFVQIRENAQATREQLQVREGWLTGVTHSSSGTQ